MERELMFGRCPHGAKCFRYIVLTDVHQGLILHLRQPRLRDTTTLPAVHS